MKVWGLDRQSFTIRPFDLDAQLTREALSDMPGQNTYASIGYKWSAADQCVPYLSTSTNHIVSFSQVSTSDKLFFHFSLLWRFVGESNHQRMSDSPVQLISLTQYLSGALFNEVEEPTDEVSSIPVPAPETGSYP
jgi:hypothetical protein